MTTITCTKGASTATVTLSENATAGDICQDAMASAMFNLSDKVVVIRGGVELPDSAPLAEGDSVQLVNSGNKKG